ncbi:glycoside hydrolase family 1 protein [Streptomyces sp. NPDC021093]|uniref:glycoside hydrolase family 1 protein n=1 Tax=Streptomyces sp. NPDC021093 TaxID=3365112 RepID=UPI00379F5652
MKRLIGTTVAVTLVAAFLTAGATARGSSGVKDPGKPGQPEKVSYPGIGSLSQPSGKGSFRFGVSTSATQIEDQNTNNDWYLWSRPAPEGLGKSEFVGDAVGGYTRAVEDVGLVKNLNVDSYRLSIEWSRIEPRRGQIDQAALDHYSKQIDALVAQGIRPVVTLHHFANPVWVDDPRDPDCKNGPSDTNLCGLDHPEGGKLVVKEMAEYAKTVAARLGDRVDEWVTLNEPMVYMTFAHSFGAGPPGKANLNPKNVDKFARAQRRYIEAHAAMYRAVKKADRVDADHDRAASSIGLAVAAQEYVPIRGGKLSDDPRDVAARDRYRYFTDYGFVDALWNGTFDKNFDGVPDEQHPEWKNTLDWLGPQLYARIGVSAAGASGSTDPSYPIINVDLCTTAPCLPYKDPSYYVPTMNYEGSVQGVYGVLKDYSKRYRGLPLVASESGIATENPKRRSEHLVRTLEQIGRARADGIDVRGYYHWSLLDNFEWLGGYKPRFGLYQVDRATMKRTPTSAVAVYRAIAASRSLSPEIRSEYGGTGPLSPETPGTPAR